MPFLQLQCFGIFQVKLAGNSRVPFGTEKVRALLAYLAIECDHPVTRQFLTGLLWPDQPEKTAQHNLRQALSTLRKLLQDESHEEPFILVIGDSLQFNTRADQWVDVHRFQEQMEKGLSLAQGKRKNSRPNIACLQTGLALYQGQFLSQFTLDDSNSFDEWVFMQRENCNQRAIQALSTLADYHERREEYHPAYLATEKLSALAPWDEAAHLQAIRLLALQGQWNQAQARYQTMCNIFTRQMALEPSPEATDLLDQVRKCSVNNSVFSPRYPKPVHNIQLPPDPFFGRQLELENLAEMIANPENQLITLLGVGGTGKSRLALQVAYVQIGLFSDGVWFVPIKELGVIQSITDTLSIDLSSESQPLEILTRYLRDKNLLLVLDSFEHVQNEVEIISKLVEAGPNIVVLVTSRQRLNLRHELVFLVEGLENPPLIIQTAAEPEKYSASALFLARMRRLRNGLSLNDDDFHALATICRLLNGLPLGLELAAAATWSNSLTEIAQAIQNNLDFLENRCSDVPTRHRSMRAAFDYSWKLLTAEQKLIFKHLSVFEGSFQRSAAETIINCNMRDITDLLDRSLLHQTQNGRFEIPEPILPYISEHLDQSGTEKHHFLRQHANYYTELFESHIDNLNGKDILPALKSLVPELGNARQAWFWAVENRDLNILSRLLSPLHQLLHTRSASHESIDLLIRSLVLTPPFKDEDHFLARVKIRIGMDFLRIGQLKKAEEELISGLAILEQLDESDDLILGLDTLATLFQKQGQQVQAKQLALRALQLSEEYGNTLGKKNALFLLADIEFRLGNLKAAESMMQNCLILARQTENPMALLAPLNSLGDYACYEEDYKVALNNFEECLQISRELGSGYHEAIQLNNLGTVHHMLANYDRAVHCYETSLATCRIIGDLEGEAISINNLGEIMVVKEEYARAIKYYERSLVIAQQIKNPRAIALSFNNLGETYRNLQNHAIAWQYFSNGLKTAWKSQIISQVLESLTGLGILLITNGDEKLGCETLSMVIQHPSTEPDDRLRASSGLQSHEFTVSSSVTLEYLIQELIQKSDSLFTL